MEMERTGSTLITGSTLMHSAEWHDEKSSTVTMDAAAMEDLQPSIGGPDKPKRRFGRWSCCCFGVWGAIGVILLLLGIAALVLYFIGKLRGSTSPTRGGPHG